MMRSTSMQANVETLMQESAADKVTFGTFSARLGAVESKLGQIIDLLGSTGKLNYGVMAAWAAVILAATTTLTGFLWSNISQNVLIATQPVNASISQIQEIQHTRNMTDAKMLDALQALQGKVLESTLSDAVSRSDRGQLNDRVKLIEAHEADNLAERKGETAALAQKTAEIETQFRAKDNLDNLQIQDADRMISVLWQRLFPNNPLPPRMFYPKMALDATTPPLGAGR